MNTAETTTQAPTTKVEIPKPEGIGPVQLNWKGVELTLDLAKEQKGPNVGKWSLLPTNELTLGNLESIVGEDFAKKRLYSVVKSVLKDEFSDSINKETGIFDKDLFLSNVANYSFISIPMSELREKQDTTTGLLLSTNTDTAEGKDKFTQLMADLKSIRNMIEQKKRSKVTASDDEDES